MHNSGAQNRYLSSTANLRQAWFYYRIGKFTLHSLRPDLKLTTLFTGLPFRLLVMLGSLCLGAGLLAAEDEHAPLLKDPALDFSTMLDAALLIAPESLESPVREQQARDYQASGKSWIAGRASINLGMYDDGALDNRGLNEKEFGLQLPLWRLGERKASQALGAGYEEQTREWQDYLRWQLTGELRANLAEIELAEAMLEVERATEANAEELHRVSLTMFEAGEVSRLDTLQTESLLLEQRQRVLQAEALMVDAERSFQVLTGLKRRPATGHRETLSPVEEVPDAHPMLSYLHTDVVLADASITQSQINAKGNPQLTIGTRRERGDRFMPYTDSLAISVNVPIGGANIVASRSSSARRQKVDAEVRWLNTRIELQASVHEAEHELFITRESLPLAIQNAALADEQRELAQSAFGLGELSLFQVLNAIQAARNAERALLQLQLREQQLITEYNQLIGEQP